MKEYNEFAVLVNVTEQVSVDVLERRTIALRATPNTTVQDIFKWVRENNADERSIRITPLHGKDL